MRTLFAFLALILGCPAVLLAQGQPDPAQAIEKVISNAISACQPVKDAGVAIAIVKNRKIFYAGGFGLRDRKLLAKVDPETFFAIGSATKAFTSLSVILLAERGTINLTTPVKTYAPDFGMNDPAATQNMTLAHILSHRTGLPRHDALWYLGPFSQGQLFYRLPYLRLNPSHFGIGFEYNNLMYAAAGIILQTVTRESWQDSVKTHILNPVGMPRTNFSLAELVALPNHAKGYYLGDELPFKDLDNIAPAGAINSNVIEMAQWVLLHLNGGTSASGIKVVEPASIQQVYAPQIDLGSGLKYGLGWFSSGLGVNRRVFHPGNADGFSAYVSFMPDHGLGVIALSNEHTPLRPAAARPTFPDCVVDAVYASLLGSSNVLSDDTTRVLSPAHSEPAFGDLNSRVDKDGYLSNPGDYTGIFSNAGYGDMTVESIGGSLHLSYFRLSWPLLPTSVDSFEFLLQAFGGSFRRPVTFSRNSAGKVEKVSILFERLAGQIEFVKR